MSVISINNLTRDYGNNKGIFNITLNVEKGEVFGFLGQSSENPRVFYFRDESKPSNYNFDKKHRL